MSQVKEISIDKVVSLDQAISHISDGCTLMVGGFAATGSPMKIINGLVEKGVKNMTLICNDTGLVDAGIGLMVVAKQFKKVIVSHIGMNPETGKQLAAKELEVELVPQGTLVERIRSGGFGLGGALTPTGVGTEVANSKQTLEIDGKTYLVEKPLKADVAIVKVKKADRLGNAIYHGTNISHGPMMATAGKITIIEADEIVEIGELDPDQIQTPSVFVDYIVQGGN
ncbi:CoA transferase subunit A [Maledivibacter halophilus]|uniref:Acetate CoA/acetoacetate CoA-transferase alpha subunit n=1 Tax=Maledivibacter halophilus TaxID=36842 RepID=A0A1T5MVY3_9FIRM|nr:CoA transferase subunit A [Maledivibacter halophilus]SKC92357.1 acetate CoA/acetoacetate CoA-transferase alpha subunit [Maledivibacter halophilus]